MTTTRADIDTISDAVQLTCPGPIRTQQPAVALGRAHRPLPEPNDHLYLAAVDFSPCRM